MYVRYPYFSPFKVFALAVLKSEDVPYLSFICSEEIALVLP
jgi:hypothetical protein